MNYYPDNTLTAFRTHLIQPVRVQTGHEVALSEISVPTQWSCTLKTDIMMLCVLRDEKSESEQHFHYLYTQGELKTDSLPPMDLKWGIIPKDYYSANEYDGGRFLIPLEEESRNTDEDENEEDENEEEEEEEEENITPLETQPKQPEENTETGKKSAKTTKPLTRTVAKRTKVWRKKMIKTDERDYTNIHNVVQQSGTKRRHIETAFQESIRNISKQKILAARTYCLDYPGIFDTNESFVDYLNDLIMKAKGTIPNTESGCAANSKPPDHLLSAEFRKNKANKIFKYCRNTGKVIIKLPKYCCLKITPNLAHILGFEKQSTFFWKSQSRLTMDIFGDINSIYVYSDIIETRDVADTTAHLLKVVSINRSDRRASTQTVTFQQLEFYPMRSELVESVQIHLRDRVGRPIPFLRGEVTVSLLIRQKE